MNVGKDVDDGDLVKLCAFTVGSENYVIDIMRIREVSNVSEITLVAGLPSLIEGVIDFRGEIVPVVDLRRVLDAPMEPDKGKRIVAAVGGLLIGLIVDAVGRVVIVPRAAIAPPPSRTDGRERVFPGAIGQQGRFYLLMNVKALLESEGLTGDVLASAVRQEMEKPG